MKRLFIIFALVIPNFTFCQTIPQAFNYQTVVRNNNGDVLKNFDANFDIQILLTDSLVYTEEHTVNTGDMGIVNFQIGKGDNPSSNFSNIDWSRGQYRLRTKINGEEIGVSDIVSVPKAFYSEISKSTKDWENIGDSVIYQKSMKIGLGTSEPKSTLHLHSNNIPDGLKITRETSPVSLDFHIASGDTPDLDYGFLGLGGNTKIRGAGKSSIFGGALDIGSELVSSRKISLRTINDVIDNRIESFDENGEVMWFLYMGDRSHNDMFRIEATNGVTDFALTKEGNVGIGTPSPDEKLVVNGRTKTNTLEITGGGDGAEYFQAEDLIEPGTLVSVDVEKEESIKVCDYPYSKKVIGVISRAGGINPGITLQQNEVLEGNNLVSLWGRVFVKATTTNGNIKPGDLLTSSSISGHVMKATNKRKRKEAVVGMALTSLEEGDGLVKILIQRQ